MSEWEHPNPVFIDFETQSACNIKEEGAYAYVNHPSTRILITVACIDNCFHVWIPDYISVDSSKWNLSNLWPFALKPKQEVRFYRGKVMPSAIVRASESIPFVAHNAFGFDRYIWERFCPSRPRWLDSLYVARLAGKPGRLDALGKSIIGQGKDRAAKLLPKLTTARPSIWGEGYSYPVINSGDLEAFTRYAIGDVEIIRRCWNEFDNVQVEPEIIRVHNSINARGIKVDIDLLDKIEQLSNYSVTQACNDIADMTDGALTESNLRSTKQVHEWLDSYGVHIVDDNGKPCLRKEIVQRFIDSPYLIDDYMIATKEIPPLVIEVLKLRMKALRITGGKVQRAKQRVASDGRIHDLIAYYLAHTGRFGSLGVQVHNLPRPIEGIDIEEILKLIKANKSGDIAKLFDRIKSILPKPDGRKYVTVDDVCSALIRPSFIPDNGKLFCIADYSKVELCCVAWMADEEKLLSALFEGRDIYSEFASTLYSVPLDQVTKTMRQVCKPVVLGAIYSMSGPKFNVYAANMGVDLSKAGLTSDQCIETFRNTYTKIAGWKPKEQKAGYNFRVGGLWKDLDRAVKECVGEHKETYAGKCLYSMEKKDLICTLPSGRRIHYPDARIEDVIPPYCYTLGLPLNPKATAVFTSNRGTKSLYGGLATENNSQGTCRDIMCDALVKFDSLKYNTVGHYHDEIVNEVDEKAAPRVMEHMIRVMSTTPDWANGFPLSAEGFISPRFTKKPFKGYKEISTKEVML